MHTPSSFGSTVNYGGQTVNTVSSQFHIYTLEWTSQRMVFSVDNVVHYIYNPPIKNASTWPFDAQQYLLLNVAMQSNVAANFTQSAMEVDYVRVYQESALSNPNQALLDQLVWYPNPVNDILIIEMPENSLGTKVKIYSLLGQELNSYFLNEGQNSLDFSTYTSGIYIVKVESDDESSKSFKISKH